MAQRRHELTDEEWARIAQHFAPAARGRPPGDARQRFNAIQWVLCTGAPWRDLPERYGPWKTAYTSFYRWTAAGIWKAAIDDLLADLDEAGKIDNELWCIDGSAIRAHRAAAGARHSGKRRMMKTR
jgi:transposase